MNRRIFVLLFVVSQTVLFAVPLEIPTTKTVAFFGVGSGSGRLSFGPDDGYEPNWPTGIATTTKGDLFVLDYRQGILHYDQSFRFLNRVSKIFHYFSVGESFVVAWNSESDPQELCVYEYGSTKFELVASMLLSEVSRIESVVSRTNLIATTLQDGSVLLYSVSKTEKKLQQIVGESNVLVEHSMSVQNGVLSDLKFGVLTTSANRFFRANGKPTIQYADTDTGKDTINIARKTIIDNDSRGFRAILVPGQRIGIADHNGNLVKVFDVTSSIDSSYRIEAACFNREGDIWFLESARTGHTLKQIDKSW